MIRTSHLQGPSTRRIAVIEMPRPQRARLGVIRAEDWPEDRVTAGWTTVAFENPADSSANFLAGVVAQQNAAMQQTPGTLTYAPAAIYPTPNVSPWNSWLQPNCPPGAQPANGSSAASPSPASSPDASPSPASGSGAPTSPVWIALGILGALASAKYLFGKEGRQGR